MPEQRPAYCLTTSETADGVPLICNKTDHAQMVRHKFIPQDNMPDPLRDALAAQMMADLEDRTDLIPADPPSADEATLAKRFQRDVQFLERKHFADLYAYEVGAGHALMEDLYALDESRWAENLTADEASLRRIKARVDAWLLQVGIREDGGA